MDDEAIDVQGKLRSVSKQNSELQFKVDALERLVRTSSAGNSQSNSTVSSVRNSMGDVLANSSELQRSRIPCAGLLDASSPMSQADQLITRLRTVEQQREHE